MPPNLALRQEWDAYGSLLRVPPRQVEMLVPGQGLGCWKLADDSPNGHRLAMVEQGIIYEVSDVCGEGENQPWGAWGRS